MTKEVFDESIDKTKILSAFLEQARNIKDIKIYKFGSQVMDEEVNAYGDLDLLISVKDEGQISLVEGQLIKYFRNVVGQNAIILNFERNVYEKYLTTPDGEYVIHLHIFDSKTYTIIKERKHELLLNTSDGDGNHIDIKKYIEHLAIRSYRLLSKIEKGSYQEVVVIFDTLKKELLLPLLSEIYLKKAQTHPKFLDINAFPEKIRSLYIECHPKPTKASCTTSVKSCLAIIQETITQIPPQGVDLPQRMISHLYEKIVSYESQNNA